MEQVGKKNIHFYLKDKNIKSKVQEAEEEEEYEKCFITAIAYDEQSQIIVYAGSHNKLIVYKK